MGVTLGPVRAEREQRLGTLQRLAPAVLVHAQHQGLRWRVEMQADHVATLSMKKGSVESWQVCSRWGWSPKAFQIRWTASCVRPHRWAIARVLQ